jgi:hypothetical protein
MVRTVPVPVHTPKKKAYCHDGVKTEKLEDELATNGGLPTIYET